MPAAVISRMSATMSSAGAKYASGNFWYDQRTQFTPAHRKAFMLLKPT